MYNNHSYHGQQRQQQKLPSLHHLMLPSPPQNYHSKLLPPPQPSHSHPYPVNTSNPYPSIPPKVPRIEPLEYFAPMTYLPSDNQVLNDVSLLFFGASCSDTIPYQSSSASSTPPFDDFILFEPLEQRYNSSSLSSKGKLMPDLNATSFY